jgi:hypothetical protein
MAFHNPDPKMREIERDNARLRARFFAELFGGALRVFRRTLLRRRVRQPCGPCMEADGASHDASNQRNTNI